MSVRKDLTSEKLIELHVRQKLSLSKIGEMYGISRQRVHQLKKDYEKSCGKINRRLIIDVFTLKQLLDKGMTAKEIGIEYNLKASHVCRLIKNYQEDYESGFSNISIKRKTLQDIISYEELYTLYSKQLMTDKEIAKKFNASPAAVCNLRKKYRIPTNNNKSSRKLHNILTPMLFKKLYKDEGLTLSDLSLRFGCSVPTLTRLKTKYKI